MAFVKQNLNLNDVGNIRDKKQYTIEDFLSSNPPSDIKSQEMVPESFSSNGVQSKNQDLPKINLPTTEQIEGNNTSISIPDQDPQQSVMPPVQGPLASYAPLLASMEKSQSDPMQNYSMENQAQSMVDPFVEKYTKQQEGLLAKREAEEAKLANSEKLTDQEKISRALLAILPGLLGAGLGAAVTGGVGGNAGIGALQGLAGGTQGSLQGLQILDQDKKQQTHQIRENIKNIDEKLDKTGLKEEQRASLLEDRNVQEKRLGTQFANQIAIEKVKQDFENGQLDKKTAAEAERLIAQGEIQKAVTVLNNNSAEKREGMQNSTSIQVAKIHADAAKYAQEIAAGTRGAKADKLTEGQQKAAFFTNNVIDAEKALAENQTKYDPTSRLQLPDGASDKLKSGDRLKYEGQVLSWLNNINYLRSGAGQSNLETERSKKELFPVPGDSAKSVQEKALKRQEMIQNAVLAYNIKNNVKDMGTPTPIKQAPHGQTVVQNGHTYNWNAQTGQYE